MVTSAAGKNLIKRFEGIRLNSYKDSVGVYTIGYGHTSGVTKNMHITSAQAETFLNQDIAKCEAALNKYQAKYNFNQNEYDALISFTFNLGAGNLKKLLKYGLRKKSEIADKIPAYNKAGGKVLQGLVRRRDAERTMFLTPYKEFMCMGVDYSKVFDAGYYASRYTDLMRAFGSDSKALFQHFLVYGMKEHRQAIATFNVDVYIKDPKNQDVVRAFTVNGVLDIPKVYQHYCEYGYKENRRAV